MKMNDIPSVVALVAFEILIFLLLFVVVIQIDALDLGWVARREVILQVLALHALAGSLCGLHRSDVLG